MINTIKLDGRLADDAEGIRRKKDDQLVGFKFRMGYNAPEGGTGWINVTCWDHQNKLFTDGMMQKGTHVAVSGAIGFDTWEKDGMKRQQVTLVADVVTP